MCVCRFHRHARTREEKGFDEAEEEKQREEREVKQRVEDAAEECVLQAARVIIRTKFERRGRASDDS